MCGRYGLWVQPKNLEQRFDGHIRFDSNRATTSPLDGITDDVIQEAVLAATSEIRQADLERLTPHQTVVYEIVKETGQVTPRKRYGEYQERVDDPKTKRTLRNYLDKMRQYNLIGAGGNTRGRTYHPLP